MQLHAGFVADAVRAHLVGCAERDFWTDVLRRLSEFTVSPAISAPDECPSLALVADNIISRGLPTLSSCFVEDALQQALGLTCRTLSERTGAVFYAFTHDSDGLLEDIKNALCIVDSRVPPHPFPPETAPYGSQYEAQFHLEDVPREVGSYAFQLFETQTDLSALLQRLGKAPTPTAHRESAAFLDQRLDFTVELPRYQKLAPGMAVEIDGSQHETQPQRKLDWDRDKALQACGWQPTLRIPTAEVGRLSAETRVALGRFFTHPYAVRVASNYERPPWGDPDRLRTLELALTPFAVARLEKTLLRLVRAGILSLEAKTWRLAVVERDVPCARLAAADLRRLLSHLIELEGRSTPVPNIQLTVYTTPEFRQAPLRHPDDIVLRPDSGGRLDVDVLLDVSVLRRSCLPEKPLPFEAAHTFIIRSSYSPRKTRKISCGPPVEYVVPDVAQPTPLVALLQDIFRKASFREGQVAILRRLLARQNTIGLLPTGAGKSLTYQLATLLQPSIALVVDPIKSLMHDQDDNLRRQGLDSTVFINSSLTTAERERNSRHMVDGHAQFVFISPERLMIDKFRTYLREMIEQNNVLVAYVVVDEAHCVSEWGQDFRTSYLRLGANARKYCRNDYGHVPIVGLTGTASFDVLTDVQRELQIEGDDAIVSPEKFERDELQFEIIGVPLPENPPSKDYELRKVVASLKQNALLKHFNVVAGAMERQPEDLFTTDRERTLAGLVFAPHVSGPFGVIEICNFVTEKIPNSAATVDYFAGSTDDQRSESVSTNLEKQSRYKADETALLVATKAFGMGIDKPNIRYTVHFSMPQSIESFYQEAGRAGRDRAKAWCSILYSDVLTTDGKEEPGTTIDRALMLSFHRNSFKGVEREKRILYEILTTTRDSNGREAPGIETLLATASAGELCQLTIPFENDASQQIAEILRRHTRVHWTAELVNKTLGFKSTAREFLQSVRSEIKKRSGIWLDEVPEDVEISKLFSRVRTESDTQKAVYRLSIVGAIREYSIDYSSKTLQAVLIVHPPEYYVQQLQDYIRRYTSQEETLRVPDRVQKQKGSSLLQKCLGFLVEFVYERIAKRRLEAISVMETAVRAGISGGSAAFAQYVNTYFDSRMTPELRKHIRDYTLDVVWNFMALTRGEVDGMNHLRGACDRLLVENPDNGALLLLRAFVAILQAPPGSAPPEDFFRGWEQFKSLGRPQLRRDMERYFATLLTFNSAHAATRDRAVLDWHAKWLRELNKKNETLEESVSWKRRRLRHSIRK